LLNVMEERLESAMCLFRLTVTKSNEQTASTHEASDSQFNYSHAAGMCVLVFISTVLRFLYNKTKYFFPFWHDSSQLARASSFTRFLDHTQRRTTVGRTPLDE
jgi:hypothetical protein